MGRLSLTSSPTSPCGTATGSEGGFTDQTKEYGLRWRSRKNLLEFLPEEKRDPLRAVLAQDPRPSYQEDPDRVYGMEFAGYEVKFTVSEKVLHVKSVEKCTV